MFQASGNNPIGKLNQAKASSDEIKDLVNGPISNKLDEVLGRSIKPINLNKSELPADNSIKQTDLGTSKGVVV